jgi:DNA-binding transcriptional LysR family regulator
LGKKESSHSQIDMSWNDVALFVAVCDERNLSRAAKRLGLSQPTLSRRLAAMEAALGYSLFSRHSDGVRLTAQGERLQGAARKVADSAAEFSRVAAGTETAASGVVRIAAAPGVSHAFVTPFAADFRKHHPAITIQVLAQINYVDLVRGEADLAIRNRGSTSPDLKTLAKIRARNQVFASRAYAKKLPPRPSMSDIGWVAWAPPFEATPPNPQLEALVPNFRPVFASDNFLLMWRAVELGLGALACTDFGQGAGREGDGTRARLGVIFFF